MFKGMLVSGLMLCVLMVVVATPVQAQNYSERSLRGAYVFLSQGTIGGVSTPAVGRIDFDGRGECTNAIQLNFGGVILPLTADENGGSCGYTVGPNGFGKATVTFVDEGGNPFPAFIIDFIIVSK